MSTTFNSPLRYPGGKGKLSNYFKLLLLENQLHDIPYVEIYAGGAGVALTLLFDEFVSEIHINDISRPVYSFWHSILYQTKEFCDQLENCPVTVEYRQEQQAIQLDPNATTLELGFSTFFLNRTNRSGIIKGGVIGGKNQNGKYKIDARFNRKDLISRIKKISRYASRIHIYNLDAVDFIQKTLPTISSDAFVYLDPPYFVKGEGLYENFYLQCDHEKIGQLTNEIKQYWVVSYDNVPEINNIYNGKRSITYSLNYSAANRYKGAEVMFFSENLKVPDVKSPMGVTAKEANQIAIEWE